ncbi:MAG: LemA family protein [Campylobacterota bacterium]
MSVTTIVVIVIIAIIVFYIINIYNKLVMYKNRIENAFAQIEVQLKRRYDLIPNLVETAKGYLEHESQTLQNVIEARNTALSALKTVAKDPANAKAMEGFIASENALQGAMGGLSIQMEAYPDLKASANMQHLSEELTSTENKVAFARQAFNDAVMAYNTYKQSFPPVVLAPSFGHAQDAKMLEFADSQQIQDAPKVSF